MSDEEKHEGEDGMLHDEDDHDEDLGDEESEDDDADEWDDELGDIDDLSDPESDLEDVLPVATTEAVAGKQAYLDACAAQRIIPVSAFIKSMSQARVSLRHYTLGKQGATAVAECLKENDSIESLDLADTWLEREGATALAEALEVNATIQYLDVSHNRLGMDDGRGIGGIAISKALRSSQQLTDVCISNNRLCDKVAEHISESLRKNATLTRLDLSHNNIRDKGGSALGVMLLSNGYLKDLDLSCNNIRSQGALKLAEAIENNRTLTCLDVASNGFGDHDSNGAIGKKLEEALTDNSVLRHLNLSHNRLSSYSAQGISLGITANKGLVSVVLDSNPFGKYGCAILMEAFKTNSAIINVGLTNIESEMFYKGGSARPEYAAVPPTATKPAAEDSEGSSTPRTLVSPRNLWRPMNLKLPSKAEPTGTYRLYLSKPWERLAAARLAKVKCEEGIEPLATIRPNLAQPGQKARPFDIVKNGKNIPETGILEVRFQMMVHPRRQTTRFKLDLADATHNKLAGELRAKASKMMHEEFAPGTTLNGAAFHIPLDPGVDRVDKWKFPAEGELLLDWVSPDLAFETPLKLDLADTLDRAVAQLMMKKRLSDEKQIWIEPTINGEPCAPGCDELPAAGVLQTLHLVDLVSYGATEHQQIDAGTGEGGAALEALRLRVLKEPKLNVCNVRLSNKGTLPGGHVRLAFADVSGPSPIWTREGTKQAKAPKIDFDLVTLVDESVHSATGHGNVLRVEEILMGECKTDKERLKELQKTLRRENYWFASDQAKKLVGCFEAQESREKVLNLLLQRVVMIQNYEQMRGCV